MIPTDQRFCIAPFTNVFIRADGAVLPCCSYMGADVEVGNLHTDSVDDILFGPLALLNRKRAMDLTLPCNGCDYSHKTNNPKNIEIDGRSIFNRDYARISKLQVEVGYFCNSRCSFCAQPHMTKESVPFEKLKEIIIKCKPAQLVLQGGEVYYNAGAPEFLDWLIENKGDTKTFMHTNCVLPLKFAEKCLDCFDDISLNLYGASPGTFNAVTGLKFEKAIAFIEELVALRNTRTSNRRTSLKFKMTTCPTTFHEIPDAILLADRLGCDSVRFAFDFFVPKFVKRYDNEFTARIWDRTNDALKQVSIPVDISKLVPFGFKLNQKVLPAVSAAMNKRRLAGRFMHMEAQI